MSSFAPAALPLASDITSTERNLALSALTAPQPQSSAEFLPREPATLEETGLTANEVEALVLKLLLTSGPTAGRRIAEQIRLPFGLVADQLRALRSQLLLTISDQATMGDFE